MNIIIAFTLQAVFIVQLYNGLPDLSTMRDISQQSMKDNENY